MSAASAGRSGAPWSICRCPNSPTSATTCRRAMVNVASFSAWTIAGPERAAHRKVLGQVAHVEHDLIVAARPRLSRTRRRCLRCHASSPSVSPLGSRLLHAAPGSGMPGCQRSQWPGKTSRSCGCAAVSFGWQIVQRGWKRQPGGRRGHVGRRAGDAGQAPARAVQRRERAQQALGIGVQRVIENLLGPGQLHDLPGVHDRRYGPRTRPSARGRA